MATERRCETCRWWVALLALALLSAPALAGTEWLTPQAASCDLADDPWRLVPACPSIAEWCAKRCLRLYGANLVNVITDEGQLTCSCVFRQEGTWEESK